MGRWLTPILLLAPGLLAGQDRTPTPGTSLAIIGGHAIDVTRGAVIENAVVLIRGERIVHVGPEGSAPVPPGSDVLDASGAWLLPGLMNMHVHFGLVLPGAAGAELADETEAELALRMAENARATLEAGVTTVRIPGDRGQVDLALKRAIDRGAAVGPRIHSAGEMVQVTGGHGSGVGEPANDGPYEFAEATRLQIRAGATWIKLAISGGIATPGGDIAAAFMTLEEMSAVTDVAHRHGAKVTAHSGSPAATLDAISVGVDCIEHGYFLTREVFARMKQSGTWYVPTIVVSQPATLPFFERIGSPQWYLDRVAQVGARHWEALETAVSEGVRIALGTDQFPHEPNDGTIATVREAEYYVEAGMSELEALRSGTIQAARMLGVDSEVGSLDAGKLADIIATPSNPLDGVSALRRITLVVKGGEVIRSDLSR